MTAGAGAGNGQPGSADGAGIYLHSVDLTFQGANTAVINDEISGSGGIIQNGPGTTILSGPTVHNYFGATVINGGTLVVNANIDSSVFTQVNAGGTLSGDGILCTVIVDGTIAPGQPGAIGTLNMEDYIHNAGGIYQVHLNPAGASDLISSLFTSTLNGGTVQVVAAPGNYALGTTYTIVDSPLIGVTGTYAAVTDNLLLVDFQDVIRPPRSNWSWWPPISSPSGLTFNQTSTATALIQSGLASLITSADQLDLLSGEIHGSAASVALEKHQLFLQTVARRLRTASYSPYGTCDPTAVVESWFMPFGLYGNVDGDGNAHGLDYNITGFAAGFDRCLGPGSLVGLSFGYAGWDLTNDLESRADVESFLLSLHGLQQLGSVYLLGVLGYEADDFDTRRPIPFLQRLASAGYSADQVGLYFEAGYNLGLGAIDLQPLAGVQYQSLWRDGFAETGADAVNLLVDEEQTSSCRSFVGGRALLPFNGFRGSLCVPEARALWLHEFVGDHRETTNRFAAAPAVAFPIRGVYLGDDFGILGCGVSCYQTGWLTLGLYYDFFVADRETAHSGSGQLQVTW